ncbi:hypothetical protein HZS_1567, partial [Henneguya salminicola]
MNKSIKEDIFSLINESVLIEETDLANYSDKEIVFLAHLEQFMLNEDNPIITRPKLHEDYINIYKLAEVVQNLGGFDQVKENKKWKEVAKMMGSTHLHVSTFKSLKHSYTRYIEPFLKHIHSAVSKKCCKHFKKLIYLNINNFFLKRFLWKKPKPTIPPLKSDLTFLNPKKLKDITTPRKKPRMLPDIDEELEKTSSSENDSSSDSSFKVNRNLTKSAEPRNLENFDLPGKNTLIAKYQIGDKVLVKYHRNKKLYEAHIIDTKDTLDSTKYLIHYYGWNETYDEWIGTKKIVSKIDSLKPKSQIKSKRGRRPKQSPTNDTPRINEENQSDMKKKYRCTYNSLQDEYIQAVLANSLLEYQQNTGVTDESLEQIGPKTASNQSSDSNDETSLVQSPKSSEENAEQLNENLMNVIHDNSMIGVDVLETTSEESFTASKKIENNDANIKILESKKNKLVQYMDTVVELCKKRDYKQRERLLQDTIHILLDFNYRCR